MGWDFSFGHMSYGELIAKIAVAFLAHYSRREMEKASSHVSSSIPTIGRPDPLAYPETRSTCITSKPLAFSREPRPPSTPVSNPRSRLRSTI